MLISKTSQYAIQSMVYMATKPQNSPVFCSEISQQLQMPAPYLSKIMQTLCRAGIVESIRGRMGGYYLSKDPEKISLLQVLQAVDGDEYSRDCVLGLKICSDETACPMHEKWKPIKEEVTKMLAEKNLVALSNAVLSGKYRISDIPFSLLPHRELRHKPEPKPYFSRKAN